MTTVIQDRIRTLGSDNAALDEVIARLSRVEAENERLQDALNTAAMAGPPDGKKKAKPTFGYYRQPDGFITASPATTSDELRYRRGGWEPLLQYGHFEMGTP